MLEKQSPFSGLELLGASHHLPEYTLAHDSRPSLKKLYQAYDQLSLHDWQKSKPIYWQTITLDQQTFKVPIHSYAVPSLDDRKPFDLILISGIHGTEPAGPVALAGNIPLLVNIGKRMRVLMVPLTNAYGYVLNKRYGSKGESVGDSTHWFNHKVKPVCSEAKDLTNFFYQLYWQGLIGPGTMAIDYHEDLSGDGAGLQSLDEDKLAHLLASTYFYAAGRDIQHPFVSKTADILQAETGFLIPSAQTLAGEEIMGGRVLNSHDASLDDFLARICKLQLVITPEQWLHSPEEPGLEQRKTVYTTHLESLLL